MDSSDQLLALNIPILPTQYMIFSGDKPSSTELYTGIKPLDINDWNTIKRIINASRLLGMPNLYLEAGSGASNPLGNDLIAKIRGIWPNYLILGGGIQSTEQMQQAYHLGVDCVVVGTAIEYQVERMSEFCRQHIPNIY